MDRTDYFDQSSPEVALAQLQTALAEIDLDAYLIGDITMGHRRGEGGGWYWNIDISHSIGTRPKGEPDRAGYHQSLASQFVRAIAVYTDAVERERART